MTKRIDVDLVVSEATVKACTQPHGLERIDKVQVPGREGEVTIYGPG